MDALPGRRYADFVETTAYLMAAEALDNVALHSHATECSLVAADRGDRLDLEIRDNGIGGAAPRPGGGLECLADRADAIGARFTLVSGRAAVPRCASRSRSSADYPGAPCGPFSRRSS